MARGECILEPGPNSWLNLSGSLLTKEGKAIVTSDPDIQRGTIEALQALEPTNMDEYPFYFSDDEKESDIGMATLSMCIRENPYATMAELVARYSDARNVPYAHVATVLNEIRRSTGFTMYLRNRGDNTFQAVQWTPAKVPANMTLLPPPKRRA